MEKPSERDCEEAGVASFSVVGSINLGLTCRQYVMLIGGFWTSPSVTQLLPPTTCPSRQVSCTRRLLRLVFLLTVWSSMGITPTWTVSTWLVLSSGLLVGQRTTSTSTILKCAHKWIHACLPLLLGSFSCFRTFAIQIHMQGTDQWPSHDNGF